MVDSKVSPSSAPVETTSTNEVERKVAPPSVVSKDPSACGVYGLVKWYNCKFNYGFISRLDNKQDLFVHRNGIKKCNPKKFKSLMDGDIVMFDVYESDKGAEARNVTGPEGKPARPSRYAKFRPWYLEILRKTRNISLDDKAEERPHHKTKTTAPRNNKGSVEKAEAQQKSSASSESNAAETPDTDVGYVSKSSSDADKKSRQRKPFVKKPRVPKPAAAATECHSCAMCDKAATAVEA